MTDSERVMRKIVEIFKAGNLDSVPSVIAAEYVDHQGLGDVEIRGPGGFGQLVMAVRSSGERVAIEDLIAEGDRVAARLSWHREQRGTSRETIDFLRIADGRAVEHWGTHS
jgi:predicted SnoaL-like aldol condensation-catalyzing enzyme